MNNLQIQIDLQKYITDLDELNSIQVGTLNHSMWELLMKCVTHCLDPKAAFEEIKLLEINSVIDFLHDELNTGHWSKVPINIRHYFTLASYLKCLILLRGGNKSNVELLQNCLKCLDMGLLLGAPLNNNLELLSSSAKYLKNILHTCNNKQKTEILPNISNKRSLELHEEFAKLKGKLVDSVECPSLEYFNNKYFMPQIPVKLEGCLQHWPATKKWTDVNYLLEVAGDRTVPIEIGSHYVDENWTQKLMTLKEFVLKHYLSDHGDIGYLAQHNLFEQITELKEDICIPEYCCLSLDYDNSTDPDINAWFGPEGTLSPLHHDPKNNLLAQMYGTKQIILFSPEDTPFLYPHEDKLLNNTAQVNPVLPDLKKHPDFPKSVMYKCLLGPGEMLFIPIKWWHHVTALEKSFSVSFWWQ